MTDHNRFRVHFLLQQAKAEPEKDHYWMQFAAEWMVRNHLESSSA